jgi:hypothetical protein
LRPLSHNQILLIFCYRIYSLRLHPSFVTTGLGYTLGLSAAGDFGNLVGLDPAILWHGAAYRLPQVHRQAPAPSASASPMPAGAPAPVAAPVAAAWQRFGLHYTHRPHLALAPHPQPEVPSALELPVALPPASAPQAAVPRSLEPPARATRSRTGSLPPPMQRYGLSAAASSLASPLPGNTCAALADANWRAAMTEEYKALVDNGTWRLVPRPPRANVITDKWVFKHKYRANDSLARYKSSTTSTMTRRSARLSNRPPSRLSSASPLLAHGRYISWT